MPDRLTHRYLDRGHLGMGGQAEVRRAFDKSLEREVAMKILPINSLSDVELLARFENEIRISARLQHPGIVPVQDCGRLADGRPFFVMKLVEGDTLTTVIRRWHTQLHAPDTEAAANPWTLRRLMISFLQICQAVSYAHSKGVVHRDLKPDNMMIGAFGEALVMDWGLARSLNQQERLPGLDTTLPRDVVTSSLVEKTVAGLIYGDPRYMAPEQMLDASAVQPTADVFALCGVLFEILTGHPPLEGDLYTVVGARLKGHLPPLECRHCADQSEGKQTPSLAESHIPDELKILCIKGLAFEPTERFSNAEALVQAIGLWLDDSLRQRQARAQIAAALSIRPELHNRRAEIAALRGESARILKSVKSYDPVELKLPAWSLEDQAQTLEREAALKEVEFLEAARGALIYDPNAPVAHELLSDFYQERHREAEETRHIQRATQFAKLLESHDHAKRYVEYLRGDGLLTLVTDPPGAKVTLYRYVERERRLVEELVQPQPCWTTPLLREPLSMGSYLLLIEAPGRVPVRYPVFIERQAHWHGVRPGEHDPFPVYLPKEGELEPDDCYVPAGWFIQGGDPDTTLPKRWLWCHGFVMKKYHVTNTQYLDFINDLVRQGREEEALKWVPRRKSAVEATLGVIVWPRTPDGLFTFADDPDMPEMWSDDVPMVYTNLFCASAYAEWRSCKDMGHWRLPQELEWEKAARGVDSRIYPWGDHFDATFACTPFSFDGAMMLPGCTLYPKDTSPYEIRNMAGSIQDWCIDVYHTEGLLIMNDAVNASPKMLQDTRPITCSVRGGAWGAGIQNCRCAQRSFKSSHSRTNICGFRLLRRLEL